MNLRLAASLLLLAGLAALRPLFGPPVAPPTTIGAAWPAEFEGAPLTATPLLAMEMRLARDFPGATAAFTDGRRRIVMRSITQATRRLHPVAACLRAGGFSVRPAPALRHPQTGLWGMVRAVRGGHRYQAREHITSADGARLWTDVSAWYWDALLHPGHGPWLAVTVIEPDTS